MPANRLTLDLTGFDVSDHQLAVFTNLFRSILYQATVEHMRGNVLFSLDGKGNIGKTVKFESFHEVAEGKNGSGG